MTEKWIKDSGLILSLTLLFFGYGGNEIFLFLSAISLIILLFTPKILYPIAYLWLKLTQLLALIVPKIFFSLVFLLIITPVGLIRKLIGKDALLLRDDYQTAFFDRNHLFVKKDLETLF
ncbi:MAG TPA: SxtJ family membrane protein [Candidatus Paceibacterota bacterium]